MYTKIAWIISANDVLHHIRAEKFMQDTDKKYQVIISDSMQRVE